MYVEYAGPDFTVTCRSGACISYTSSVSRELLQVFTSGIVSISYRKWSVTTHTLSGDKVSPRKGYKLFMGTSI